MNITLPIATHYSNSIMLMNRVTQSSYHIDPQRTEISAIQRKQGLLEYIMQIDKDKIMTFCATLYKYLIILECYASQ